MPDAGFFGQLLGGFNRASATNRQILREDEDRQSAREEKILGTLIQSDDPDISSAALSAMAEIAAGGKRPKEGFLQRIVGGGRAAVHPALAPLMNLLHTPGQLDVDLGRAQAPGGATPRPSGRTPGGAGVDSGGPPVVAPPAPGPRPASVPAGPMSAGGPPSVSALGSPAGVPSRAQPSGLAPAPDLGSAANTGETSEPERTAQVPPIQNTPPQSATAARATSAPSIGGPPSILPMQGQASPTFNRTVFLPPDEVARRNAQRHAEGIELDLNARVNGALKVWDVQHPGASPEEKQAAHDQILEKELGTAPKWTGIAGTVTRDRLPPGTVDVTGQVMTPNLGAPTDRFVLQQSGSRVRAIPTTAPAGSANTLNADAQLAHELFGRDLTALDPTQMAALAKERNKRAVTLAGEKATVTDAAQTAAMAQRWQPVSVMDSTGLIHPAEQNGVGALRDPGTKQPVPDDWIKVTASAALPPKLGQAGKAVIQGVDVMARINERMMKMIEDAGLQESNDPLAVRWDNFLYGLGMDPGELQGMPFAEYAQLGGTSEAYGLNGLIRGRPNQSLQEIYQRHLVGANNTPALVYKKLKELNQTIVPIVRQSVLDAESTRLAPPTTTGTRPGTTPTEKRPDVRMTDPKGNVYDVHPDDVAKAIAQGWKRGG